MIRQQMEYGAISAKVMAMYGKMLKDDDWRRLCECRSIAEICKFLSSHRGWSSTMSELPANPTVKVLETAVRRRVYEESERLSKYLVIEDKKYLRLFLCRCEYDFILDALKPKENGASEQMPKSIELTDFMRKNSSVNLGELERSRSFSDVQNAVRDSIYYKPLSELKPDAETGMPSYREAGVVLENAYFKSVFAYLSGKYKGGGRKKLEETIGLEADLLNTVSIIRLQRSFHTSLERADELLIPISYHLKPEFLHELSEAKSEGEALDMLRRSPFGKRLEGADTNNIESLFYKSMEKFCRRLVKTGGADLGVPQAYLVLKELECNKLCRVIEAVASGIDPRNVI